MSGQNYPAHGRVVQRREGQLLIADLHGPWNIECMQDAVRRANPQIDEMLRAGPVGIIVIAHDSMLGTPDALGEIRERSLERRPAGNIAVAWVAAPEVEGRAMMVTVLEEVYRDTLPMRMFTDCASAERWIKSFMQARSRAREPARSG
jgi:hypothetical protein